MSLGRCAIAGVVAVCMLITSNQAPATGEEPKVVERVGGRIVIVDDKVQRSAPTRTVKNDTRKWYPYKIARSDGNGGYCLVTRWSTNSFAPLTEGIIRDTQNVLAPAVARPDCPRPPRAERARVVAQEFWAERTLPTPEIKLQPPFAVTGKPTYLEIVGERAKQFEVMNEIDGEMVVIEATSDYVVDWGDRFNPRTNLTTTTSQGGPWPDGDVTHTYTHVDPGVTITVTQRWRAVWSSGEDGGVLEGLSTTARVDDYRVTEIEAVRIR